ncbi:MAG: UDP-N-acetylglucosamine 2-epimerase (non-hydrolyzing) [Clostridia bacterium]|nr:UDP-N-acetylglucosamine 2-epimerase (non-hydrolyzing) [Clostridia bacterium]
MKRIMIVMGTRPEAVKLCPLVRELRSRGKHEILVLSTGQHRAMLDSALEAFSVKPDFDMDVMQTGQTLSEVTAKIVRRTDELLGAEKPDLVLVQGDTTTAFAAGLAAFHRQIPVGHVEAGLRTYQMRSPFPEEFHRQAISLFADYHFSPTVTAKKNLIREGKQASRVFVTGNTVVDALRITLTEKKPRLPWSFPEGHRVIVFTAHRRESWGAPIRGMLRALRRIVETHPNVTAVFPVHHNPQVRAAAREILTGVPRVRMIEPPEIVSFHHLLARADLILTDSGGIQEEASALGVPTLVMRYSSERVEGLRTGVLKLVGGSEEGIFSTADRLLSEGSEEYLTMKKPSSIYGKGRASAAIADVLDRVI